ncbi:hypothetical protein BD410DRAFT_845087 [Rickenella mellea]|uniref:HCP-like protein n=1 Tax=Rickenella mellea TaxID=50990 RepID=A0A4Y7PJD6_9AGAM|nr:hypothetical protein BD410DRAFT_845087 [Rickenella mellea]
MAGLLSTRTRRKHFAVYIASPSPPHSPSRSPPPSPSSVYSSPPSSPSWSPSSPDTCSSCSSAPSSPPPPKHPIRSAPFPLKPKPLRSSPARYQKDTKADTPSLLQMARTLESQVYGSAPGPGPGPVGYGAPAGGGGYGGAPAPTGAPYRATSPYAPLAYPQQQQQQPLPQPHQYAQPQPPPPPPQQQQYSSLPQQYGDPYRQASPYPPPPPLQQQQQQQNYNPGGFAFPSPAPAPAPASASLGGGGTYTPSHSHRDSLSASMAALSFSPPPSRQRTPSSAHHPSPSLSPQPQLQSSPQQQPYAQLQSSPQPQQGPPALTAPLPTISSLSAALPSIQALPINADPSPKVAWCRDVLALVNRVTQAGNASTGVSAGAGAATSDPAVGAVHLSDPALARLADTAVSLILQLSPLPAPSSGTSTPQPTPPTSLPLAESLFLRATLEASGAFPHLIRQDPRTAFRDYEASARAGYHPAWFRLGRDYETFGDDTHAKECFERGVRYGDESCLYRMGMANLMGQLGLPASPAVAVPLLHRAATLATVDVPQPAYVYGLLLLSEFSHVTIPPSLFTPLIPPTSTPPLEARKHLERAAFLNFAPAQYKLGHAYEFAKPPFPYDALLSVQYYSLASQQGEPEADMALSKWFLCGAEGSFEKDEALAFTFAEKAARKGLPSAEFAMGYYKEVGVGCARDVDAAKAWYEKAAANGNTDAPERLRALSQPAPQALSRQEHDTLTESKLMRKRTQAQKLSDAQAYPRVHPGRAGVDASQVVEVIRRNSRLERPGAGVGADRRRPSGGAGGGVLTPAQQLQAQYQQQQQQQPLQPTQPLRVAGAAHLEHSSTLPHAPPQQRPAHRHGYSLSDTPAPFPGAAGGGGPGVGPGGRANSPGRPARGRGRGGHGYSPSATPNPHQAGLAPPPPPLASPPIGSGPAKDGFGVGAGGVGAPGMDKYQTFAEMGFQSQKLEEKDCVIM